MMVPKKQETFPPEFYSAPSDAPLVKFVIQRCRSCDQMSDWSDDVVDDQAVSKAAMEWRHDHFEKTGHRNFYEIGVSRGTVRVVGFAK
jgi:hypothetical protein